MEMRHALNPMATLAGAGAIRDEDRGGKHIHTKSTHRPPTPPSSEWETKRTKSNGEGGDKSSKRAKDGEPAIPPEWKKILPLWIASTNKIQPMAGNDSGFDVDQDVCPVCLEAEDEDDSDFILCDGGCLRSFHQACVGIHDEEQLGDEWLCNNCKRKQHGCFVCGTPGVVGRSLLQCSVGDCGKYYHPACVVSHPLTRLDEKDKTMQCPRHTCATCDESDTKIGLMKCLYCPRAYHPIKCLAPSCVFNNIAMVCGKHRKKKLPAVPDFYETVIVFDGTVRFPDLFVPSHPPSVNDAAAPFHYRLPMSFLDDDEAPTLSSPPRRTFDLRHTRHRFGLPPKTKTMTAPLEARKKGATAKRPRGRPPKQPLPPPAPIKPLRPWPSLDEVQEAAPPLKCEPSHDSDAPRQGIPPAEFPLWMANTLTETLDHPHQAKDPDLCQLCLEVEDAAKSDYVLCDGPCGGMFHTACVGIRNDDQLGDTWHCTDCLRKRHVCFACGELGTDGMSLLRCCVDGCGKFYHPACILHHPLTQLNHATKTMQCPRHMCEVCDDAHKNATVNRCLYCPRAFHAKCIPPSAAFNNVALVCGKHRTKKLPVDPDFVGEVSNKTTVAAWQFPMLFLPRGPPSMRDKLSPWHFRLATTILGNAGSLSKHVPPPQTPTERFHHTLLGAGPLKALPLAPTTTKLTKVVVTATQLTTIEPVRQPTPPPSPAKTKKPRNNPLEVVAIRRADLPLWMTSANRRPATGNFQAELAREQEVCRACLEADTADMSDIILCDGGCLGSFHLTCVGVPTTEKLGDLWLCPNCTTKTHACLVCGDRGVVGETLLQCSVDGCGKYYHPTCVLLDLQTDICLVKKTFRCPRHVCATCNDDNTRGELRRCLYCHRAYHGKCLPPSGRYNNLALVCGKHREMKLPVAPKLGPNPDDLIFG
ncbi:Aste57867_1640 [Aphanomyces stellatus]|uniref:Aste57867_1640 protein n=1 Tax=Aphanomyces stellatus TaxID=120398 RepID=A0A485K661_9STRA|nr:hypothetical protein As57867_001638 [Aphanomyces stellatus]VFT78853.1 Aste57867_1640 [Aphanomyces stellatus]